MNEEIVTVSAKVPLELQKKLDEIKVVLNLGSRSEVVRRGLEHLVNEFQRKEYTNYIRKDDDSE